MKDYRNIMTIKKDDGIPGSSNLDLLNLGDFMGLAYLPTQPTIPLKAGLIGSKNRLCEISQVQDQVQAQDLNLVLNLNFQEFRANRHKNCPEIAKEKIERITPTLKRCDGNVLETLWEGRGCSIQPFSPPESSTNPSRGLEAGLLSSVENCPRRPPSSTFLPLAKAHAVLKEELPSTENQSIRSGLIFPFRMRGNVQRTLSKAIKGLRKKNLTALGRGGCADKKPGTLNIYIDIVELVPLIKTRPKKTLRLRSSLWNLKGVVFGIFLLLISPSFLQAQEKAQKLHFLETPDSLHKGRFWMTAAAGTAIYSTASIILWNSWYKDYPISSFHTFNDWGEWQHMDKVGHFTQAWIESYNGFNGALWTGMKRRNAMWTGAALGTALQLTVEVMDGFSENWGFSWGDIAFNTLGTGFFIGQELLWQEQRFKLKVSSNPPTYTDETILSADGNARSSPKIRAEYLYGGSGVVAFFKDYNAQTYWLSGNVHSFLKDKKNSRFPKWLNIAVGYGAENMYGGYGNAWTEGDHTFTLDDAIYPRYKQFYLSFDVDLSKLPVKNPFARLALGLLNWVKIPAPALEMNTLGEVKFHPFLW